jgi:hypothetical protein
MLVQLLTSMVVLAPALVHLGVALPGQPGLADLPGTVNYHWLVHSQGLDAAASSSLMMFPAEINRLILDGVPLDALASLPFTALFGWPTGFTLFVWMCLFALGLSTSWLAQGWWNSFPAAVCAGVVAQCHPFLIREVLDGRPTQLFGAIFLPLCLGFAIRSAHNRSMPTALIAGLFWGLGTLSYWIYGAFYGLALLAVLVSMIRDGRPWIRPAACWLSGVMAVTFWPLWYTLGAGEGMPGKGVAWSDLVTHGDHALPLWQLIEFRDLGASIMSDRVLAAQTIVALLMVVAVRQTPRRLWLLPAIWIGLALSFGAGPRVGLDGFSIPGPFALFNLNDWTRRFWWPERALVLAVPATALLVGGGVKALIERIRPNQPWVAGCTIACLLLAEAFFVIPGLPMPTTWGAESRASAQLSQGGGPVLILPLGSGGVQPDARMLIDQIHHGRPLVNGPMPFTSSTAPAAYAAATQSQALLDLVSCEKNAQSQPLITTKLQKEALLAWPVSTVYLDISRTSQMAGGGALYRACIERILGEPSGGDPLLEYPI